jgi:hypothetical protein
MNTAPLQFIPGMCMKTCGEVRVNTAARILNLGTEIKLLD